MKGLNTYQHELTEGEKRFGVVPGEVVTLFGEPLQVLKIHDHIITLTSPERGNQSSISIPFEHWNCIQRGTI